jgi:hypothetical protein
VWVLTVAIERWKLWPMEIGILEGVRRLLWSMAVVVETVGVGVATGLSGVAMAVCSGINDSMTKIHFVSQ